MWQKVLVVSVLLVLLEIFWNPGGLMGSSLDKPTETWLTKSDQGREVTVKVGDTLHIALERSGGTGYQWYLDKSYGNYFELLEERTETQQNRSLIGAPVVQTWKWKAILKGETSIRLLLYRDWEGADRAVDTFKVKVKIL